MPLILACQECEQPLQLRSRHRGRVVPCPACGHANDIPEHLEFSDPNRESMKERKTGNRLLFFALLSGWLWFPPLSALMWWWTSNLIRRAERAGRNPPEPVRIACVVAWVVCLSQLVWWTVKIGPNLI